MLTLLSKIDLPPHYWRAIGRTLFAAMLAFIALAFLSLFYPNILAYYGN